MLDNLLYNFFKKFPQGMVDLILACMPNVKLQSVTDQLSRVVHVQVHPPATLLVVNNKLLNCIPVIRGEWA